MEIKTLADILTPDVITVTSETGITEALRMMQDNRISCIISVKDNRPEGIITERNVVQFIARHDKNISGCTVREIMSSPVITATAAMPVFEAYDTLSSHKMRHLAVVDDDANLIGVVTLSNIIENLPYESFVETKQVCHVMTSNVVTVSPSISVQQALLNMADKSMSCIVITKARKPLGILTERDVSRLHMNNPDLTKITVGEVMTTPLQTVTGDTILPTAIQIMKQQRLRHLIVTDKEGNIEGIATQSDIDKGLEGKYIEALNEVIREKDHLLRNTSKVLDEKTAYLDNILSSSIDYGIIASDLNNLVIYFNPGAEEILGIKAEKVLGRSIHALHEQNDTLLTRLNEVLNTISNGDRTSFVIVREENNCKQILKARASGIIDKKGQLAGYFLMISDITARKQAEESLKKAHNELEQRVEERTKELAKAMYGSIEAIALTVEMRDPYTSGHQRRVADLAAAISRKIGLSSEKTEGVYMAGLLHDIGKIKVPAGILSHPGRLSEAEFAIIKPHPEVGYSILKGIDFPWPLANIVLQHHERLDGSGYPQGLKSDAILLKAKILAVADVVEAMSSHRPYRAALGLERALNEIITNKGKHYDADVVDACVSLFNEEEYNFPPHTREEDDSPHHQRQSASF